MGQGQTLLGAADATTLAVVETLSVEDTDTWEWISQNADVAGVLAYIERENPRSLDLAKFVDLDLEGHRESDLRREHLGVVVSMSDGEERANGNHARPVRTEAPVFKGA